MSKDISTIWTDGATTQTVGSGDLTTEITWSKYLYELYPLANNKRPVIDTSFYNWSIGIPELQTIYTYNNDIDKTINNARFSKSLGSTGNIPVGMGRDFSNQVYSMPYPISTGGVSTNELGLNYFKIASSYNYDELIMRPSIKIVKINKSTGIATIEAVADYTTSPYKNIQEDDNNYYAVSAILPVWYVFDISTKTVSNSGLNTYTSGVVNIRDAMGDESGQYMSGASARYGGIFNSMEIRITNNNFSVNYFGATSTTRIPPEWSFYTEDKTYPERQNIPISNTMYLKNDENIIMKLIASMGYYFQLGTSTSQIYMPIIKNNATTGEYVPIEVAQYVESDNKNWHNTDDITYINSGSDKDVIDPMDSNDVYSLSGVVKYYLMNSATLAGMMNDIENITDDPNIMNGFVSCYQIPLQSDNMVVTGEGSNIRINGHALNTTANRVVAGKTITLASFSVPRRHGNAYDYMTKYFVYTPYTDVIPLNYKCAGNTILIQLHPCVENCTASITVKCNNMIIYKTTVAIGTTSAITVENNAEKQLSIVNSCAKYAGSALSTGVGVATGNIPAVTAGAIGLIASTTHAMTAFLQSYNHSYGTNSGNMLSLMPSGIYLIEYVVKPDKPDNFARINGNIVNKSATIITGMGFTKLDKPRISTTLTAPENAELIAMLENGVIL